MTANCSVPNQNKFQITSACNVIGNIDSEPTYIPTSFLFAPFLRVLGGDTFDHWLNWQMLQQVERGDGILCFDPDGKYATDLLASIDKRHAKRVVWFDLDDEGRLIPLNPLHASERSGDAEFYEFRDFLFSQLKSITPEISHCLQLSLWAVFMNAESNRLAQTPCLPALIHFLRDSDYRWYVLAYQGVRPDWPSHEVFEQTAKLLETELSCIFEDNHWRGLLCTEVSPSLAELPDWRDRIILVTGSRDKFNSIGGQFWQFAFFKYLKTNLLAGSQSQPFHIYGLDEAAFDMRVLDNFIARSVQLNITMTYAANSNSDHMPSTRRWAAHIADFQPKPDAIPSGQPFGQNDFVLRTSWPGVNDGLGYDDIVVNVPKEDLPKNYFLVDICKRYSRFKYGRKIKFVLAEVEARIGRPVSV